MFLVTAANSGQCENDDHNEDEDDERWEEMEKLLGWKWQGKFFVSTFSKAKQGSAKQN